MSAFRLQVSDLIGRAGASRTAEFTADLEIAMDMAVLTGPVSVNVRLDVTSQDIIAAGTVDYRAVLTCHRCLNANESGGRARFSQVYRFRGSSDDVDIMEVDANGFIDLFPPVNDEVGLSLPLAPICREDCAGLCPTCGNDLNTEPCGGHEELSSSPFAVLEHLLDPQE